MAFSYQKYKESEEVARARAALAQGSTYNESASVAATRNRLNNNSTYRESTAVQQARNNLEGLKAPGEYQSQYQGNISALMNQINNREKFSYDLNGDALYQQYKDQYINQGRMAMMDTMGQAAALTGGYGNSYAASAGNQAYQESLKQLNDIVPDLYRLALDKYNSEGQDLYNQYAMYNDQEQAAYGRYRDSVSDYQQNRAYLQGVYDNERDFDYSKFTDYRDYLQKAYENERNYDYTKFNDNRDFLANQYQDTRNYDYGLYSDAYNRAFSSYQQNVAEQQFNRELAMQQDQFNRNYALEQARLNETIRANKANEAYNNAVLAQKTAASSSKPVTLKGGAKNTNAHNYTTAYTGANTFKLKNGKTIKSSTIANDAAEFAAKNPGIALDSYDVSLYLANKGYTQEIHDYWLKAAYQSGMKPARG